MCKRMFILVLSFLAITGCGSEKSTDQLIADLQSAQEKDRIIAARLLGHRKGDAARTVPALVQSLKDGDGDVRWSAAIGLGYFGKDAREAIPALQTAQSDRDARVREAARVALSRIDPEQAANPAPSKRQGKSPRT
jgi:HEAT repeat protein